MFAETAWVLRLDDGGWWSGRGRTATSCPFDAASFPTVDEMRAAMRSVGWAPCSPGWIEPLRIAAERSAPVQLTLVV